MRVTEAIARLEQILDDEGDLELVAMVCTDEGFYADEDHTFEILDLAVNVGDEPTAKVAFVDRYAVEETASQ